MKQLLVLLVLILWVAGLLFGVYYIYPKFFHDLKIPASDVTISNKMHLLDADLEQKLTFFMATKLSLYKAKFEIVDMVNMDTYNATGLDYVLIIMNSPDGRLCQVTISRPRKPLAKWEIDPENFSLVQIPLAKSIFGAEDTDWLQDAGINVDEARQYYRAHPEIRPWDSAPFIDKATGLYKLPADWKDAVGPDTAYNLAAHKEGNPGFTTRLKIGKNNPSSTYWKVDYPSDYLGPGYRAYLYDKVKQDQ